MKSIRNRFAVIFSITMGVILFSSQVDAQIHQPRPLKMFPDSIQVEQMIEDLSLLLKLNAEQKKEFARLHHSHFRQARRLKKHRHHQQMHHKKNMNALMDTPEVVQMADIIEKNPERLRNQETEHFKNHQEPFDHAKKMIQQEKKDFFAHKKTMNSLRLAFEAEINNLLNDEQEVLFRRFREERKKPRRKTAYKL